MNEVVCNGLRFNVRAGSTDEKVIPEVVKQSCYTKRGFLSIETGERWLDLGGNIGTFSVLAASKGALVTTYEPETSNFDALQSNLALNGLVAKLHKLAVVQSEPLLREFYLAAGSNHYRHTLKQTRGRKSTIVRCAKFADVLKDGYDAIKMDIEGAELEILSAVQDWKSVKKIAMEYHFDHDRSVANFIQRMRNLEDAGFTVQFSPILEHVKSYDFYPAAKIVHCVK